MRVIVASTPRVRSVVQQKQQFDVDPHAFGALLFEEVRDVGAGTRWTVMSSLSSPPPSPIFRTPCARTSVKLSESMPGEA